MKEYFTMTAHWIHIGGSPLAPTWELRHRVLGSYSVEDSPIDHQGARTLSMPLSHAEFPLSLQRFLIAALLCTYSRCQACRGTMPFVQFAVDFLLLSPIVGPTSPRLSTPPFNGIGFAVDAISYTMWWTRGWRAWRTMPLIPHKPLLQWYRRRWTGQCYCLIIALLHKWFAYCAKWTCV